MKVNISVEIQELYKEGNKNINTCLDLLLGSLDYETCRQNMLLMDKFECIGEKTEVDINDETLKRVNDIFVEKGDQIVERLIWIANMYPEV